MNRHEVERVGRAAHENGLADESEFPGSQPRHIASDGRIQNLKACSINGRERAGLGRNPTDERAHRLGGLSEVDLTVDERKLRSQCYVALLGFCASGSIGKCVDDSREQFRTRVRQGLEQIARGLVSTDRLCEATVDGSGVEFRHELKNRGSGDVIAGDDRSLHGRSSAPPRQQREVKVDPAQPRGAEQWLAYKASVSHDHSEIGLQRLNLLGRVPGEAVRADDGKPQFFGDESDWGRR